MIKIAEIPFLNCAPYYWNKEIPGLEAEWTWANPRDLGKLIHAGQLDAGPVSLLDTLGLEGRYEPMPFGITAKNFAQSVVLFSKRPAGELHEEQVGLTPQSSTSTELLKILFRERLRVVPIFSAGFSDNDSARLYIGDQAIFALLDPAGDRAFPYRMDLGREWKAWRGHSFVFARWMVNKNLAPAEKSRIANWLARNVRDFESDPDRAIRRFEAARGWRWSDAKSYLEGFKYNLMEQDYSGSLTTLSQFSSHLATSKS